MLMTPAKTLTSAAQAIPVSELTKDDLEYIRIRAARIVRSLTMLYRHHGPNRFLNRGYDIPRDKTKKPEAAPAVALHLTRVTPEREIISEAFIEIGFTMAATQNTNERQLVTSIRITNDTLGTEYLISLLGKPSDISKTIFDYLKAQKLIANPFFDHHTDDDDLALHFSKIASNRPVDPNGPILLTEYRREHIDFIRKAVRVLGRNLRNRYRLRHPIFKDVDASYAQGNFDLILKFKVNPGFKTIRDQFTVSGDLDLFWAGHGQAGTRLMFTPRTGLHLNGYMVEPFDLCARADSIHDHGNDPKNKGTLLASSQIFNMILASGYVKGGKEIFNSAAQAWAGSFENVFEMPVPVKKCSNKQANTRRQRGMKFGRGDRPRRDADSAFKNKVMRDALNQEKGPAPLSVPHEPADQELSAINQTGTYITGARAATLESSARPWGSTNRPAI